MTYSNYLVTITDGVSTVALLSSFSFTQKLVLFSTGVFQESFVIVACCTFRKLKIRTLTPNRFQNQTSDLFKLISHKCNHHQGFFKQKIVDLLHCCSFKLKFPKRLL